MGCKVGNSFLWVFWNGGRAAHPTDGEDAGATRYCGGYNGQVQVRLRDFRREDFETLWRIDQSCFAPGISYSRLELAAYIRRQGAVTLIAESPEQSNDKAPAIVGFIVAEASRRGIGHIITIDVLPAARRFGVGSKLLAAAEERLQNAGIRRVFLETAVDNQAALSFYKRHGYFLTKTVPRYYSNDVDAFVLEKDLHSLAKTANFQR